MTISTTHYRHIYYTSQIRMIYPYVGDYMVAVLLVVVFLMYIIILFGLTLWFEKYHYYRSTYFNQKTDAIDIGLSGSVAESPILASHENSNPRQCVKRGVQGKRES